MNDQQVQTVLVLGGVLAAIAMLLGGANLLLPERVPIWLRSFARRAVVFTTAALAIASVALLTPALRPISLQASPTHAAPSLTLSGMTPFPTPTPPSRPTPPFTPAVYTMTPTPIFPSEMVYSRLTGVSKGSFVRTGPGLQYPILSAFYDSDFAIPLAIFHSTDRTSPWYLIDLGAGSRGWISSLAVRLVPGSPLIAVPNISTTDFIP